MKLNQNINNLVPDNVSKKVVEYRRLIHANPELGFEEKGTQALVSKELKRMGLKPAPIAGTGVCALVSGTDKNLSKKTLLLRADLDALPVTEQADVPWKSKNPGKMHACGHDAHTAMLLGASEILANKPLPGTVKLCFQPSEETGTGAQSMIDAGILENPKVSAAFGLHVWSGIPTGKMAIMHRNALAAVDEFEIKVIGVGGHAALPHQTVDPIFIAGQLITALQSVVSRNVDPLETAVLTITGINSPDSFNVIPPYVNLKGTVRTFNEKLRKNIVKRLTEISKGVAKSLGGNIELNYVHKIPPTINDPDMADIMWQAGEEILGKGNVFEGTPVMGGEDFGLFLRNVPGCFGFLGMANPEIGSTYPHHHPKFSVDEACLPLGVAILYRTAELYFGS